MRNFSAISHVNFQSYTVNGGEYCKTVDALDVVEALALAFESSKSDVMYAWGLAATQDMDSSPSLAPSEFRVLQELNEFVYFVCHSIGNDGADTTSKIFSYFNLNTGVSVIWSHVVG